MRAIVFDGFPHETLRFLRELGENNNRDWFHAHREEYEGLVLERARDFVVALGEELERFAPGVHADPRVNGSIFRINRDTRFSRDKRPYKDHLDLWFWQGEGPSRACPGYWFRLTPKQLLLGAGMHRFEKAFLERYRDAVADPQRGEALRRVVEQVRAAGYGVGGRRYKRIPSGYEAPTERADFLLHDGLYGGAELPVPAEAFTPEFPAFCGGHYRKLAPVQEWVLELIEG